MDFTTFFQRATGGQIPYPYQARLAQWPGGGWPTLLKAPTGAGKTEAVVVAWLWRRLAHPEPAVRQATPRRLVYCLPMRTLVTQTEQRIRCWLKNLAEPDAVTLAILMGGETSDDAWRRTPEKPAIIIGTQDMLLSRALNRGYAQSPYQWPIDFGLINNDCLWVLDEVQLMQNGLPTSTQLDAFRRSFGAYGPTHTLWMSATLRPEWLQTVDFATPAEGRVLDLSDDDYANAPLQKRRTAVKLLHQFLGQPFNLREVAVAIAGKHQPGTLTLAVLNTVARAQEIYQELEKLKQDADLRLVHSRFRLAERQGLDEALRSELPPEGRIIVATQAVEAGVDLDARTLFTDLAPWSSLVQRFGRCNRRGKFDQAEVYWLDLPDLRRQGRGNPASPYEVEDLERAREQLLRLQGHSVGPSSLPSFEEELNHRVVLRRRDLVGLFDTTADLSGNYLDVSRFVRGTDETDVHVFWRDWEGSRPHEDGPAPARDELCSVPIGDLRDFLGNRSRGRGGSETETADPGEDAIPEAEDASGEASAAATGAPRRSAWRWDHLLGQWEPVRAHQVYPGQTLMLRAADGGYTADKGWDAKSATPVPVLSPEEAEGPQQEAYDSEHSNTGQKVWVPLCDHSLNVRDEAHRILDALAELALPLEVQDAVVTAAHYHDLGKAHSVFQDTMLSNLEPEEESRRKGLVWAKRGRASHPAGKHKRAYFRHEVASALALLNTDAPLEGWAKDLAAYLAAAHHGKVRLGMRSLPKARDQGPDRYYLLGFRIRDDGTTGEDLERDNHLPAADLGGGVTAPETTIDLAIAHIGVTGNGETSWLERTLALHDRPDLGPFRLAYLEALVRAADIRATKAEQPAQREGGENHG